MMETKPTTSLRERRISPSPARPSSKNSPPEGKKPSPNQHRDNTYPPVAKKPLLIYLKPKAVPSPESPTLRIPIVPSTAGATNKAPSARGLANKAPSPSIQRSLKSATPTPKPSSSSMPNGHKTAQTVSRTARTNLVHKSKSTSPTFVKKKEAPVTVAVTSEGKISSSHDAVTAFERPVKQQLWNNHKKLVEALNKVENVEESDFISSLVDEENHIEELKIDEPESGGEVLLHQVFDELSKETVIFEEASVLVASTPVEVEHVDTVMRRVDPEVRKPMMFGATVVTAMPAVKKDEPISNNAVEETKNTLLGTRKNKVLELVGAFETVISLQEREGQQIQKALQLQHGKQSQQVQQVELSFGNEKYQNQEIQKAQNAQQLGGDEVHQQRQVAGERHEKEKGEHNAMLKEGVMRRGGGGM